MKNFLLCISFMCLMVSTGFNQGYGSFASAMFMDVNGVTQFYNCSGHGGPNAIGSVQFVGSFGTFVQGTGLLSIRGAEIKTWKNVNANVCTPRIYYRVYPAGSPTGSFSNFNINFFCNCINGSFAMSCGGGPCGGNDQKWQTPGSGLGVNIDLTSFSPGNYELEVYYEIPGNNSGTSGCSDLQYDSNGGANYKMSFTIQAAPMPVILSDISVVRTGKGHMLKWNTLSESNNSHFDILASENGNNYTSVGRVEGAGDSRSLVQYEFFNSYRTSIFQYYKIRQVDFDGKFSYSEVVRVLPIQNLNTEFGVFPNPVTDNLNVYSSIGGVLEIRDFSARLLGQHTVLPGENTIPIQELTQKGFIFVQVRSESTVTETRKVLVY